MKIEYQDNKNLPPGHGFLVFSEDLFPEGPWQISIQRSSDQKYLAGKNAGQWVGETSQISIDSADLSGSTLKIPLDPAIVDSLDQKDQYRIILKGKDGIAHPGRLKIGKIAHSMGNNLDNTARIQKKTTPVPPSDKPAQAPERKIEKPSAAEPLTMRPESGPVPGNVNRRRWVLPLLGLLALLCLAWWYFDPRSNRQPEESASRQEASSGQKAATQAPNTGALPDAERAVREFFAGSNLTPVNALALARSLPDKTPAEQDAIYRLYYYAATSTNPDGLMEYGNCLDPSTPQWGTIEKNGVEAWQVYEKAAAKNGQEAEAAIDRLRKWLEEESAAGNLQAAGWLGSIKK